MTLEGTCICIAIAKPKDTFISQKTLKNCWDSNPHGAGFAFIDENQTLIVQKFMTFKSFYDAFVIADTFYGESSDFLIHFRITSRGSTTIDNCHPFVINDKMAFIHNGTITSMPVDNINHKSDTRIFNEEILQKLPENWEDNNAILNLIAEVIGWSKIVILHATKGLVIINEKKGEVNNGIWYSNSTYKDKYNYYADSYYKSNKHDSSDWDYDRHDINEWDWRVETLREFNIRKDKELKEIEAKQLLLIESKKEKVEEAEEVLFIQCQECKELVDIEDMYTIQGETQTQIKIVCEDCLCLKEKEGVEYTLITLDDGDFVDLIEQHVMGG